MRSIPIPVDELFDDGREVACAHCGAALTEAVFDGQHNLCEPCAVQAEARARRDARIYARQYCQLTGPVGRYDPLCEYRCTPEEYELGDRESYSPEAYLAWGRHNCTNYDVLIAPLDRDGLADQVYYEEIRARADAMVAGAADVPVEIDEYPD